MRESRKRLLQLIYSHEQKNSDLLQFDVDDPPEGIDPLAVESDVSFLEDHNYIVEPISVIGSYCLRLTEKGERFVESGFEYPSYNPAVSSFNLSGVEINNAIIGNNLSDNTISVNSVSSISELEKMILSKPSEDQELLKELLNLLKSIDNSEEPVEKNIFSRFSDILKKHADLIVPIVNIVAGFFGITTK